MTKTDPILGGCMCGAVRYEADAPPLHIGYCHCRSCRHHGGAAVAGMLVFSPEAFRVTRGACAAYVSSPGVSRGFCRSCGTSLTWEGRGLLSVHIGTLDDPDRCPPRVHWRIEERSPWVDDMPDLPHVKMVLPDEDHGA